MTGWSHAERHHNSQQAVSALTNLPDDMFQGSGAVFTTLGFEYWANPQNPPEGFITWVSDGVPSVRMGAAAVGEDKGVDGSQVSQRLIPEEPMVRFTVSSHACAIINIVCLVVHHSQLGHIQYVPSY